MVFLRDSGENYFRSISVSADTGYRATIRARVCVGSTVELDILVTVEVKRVGVGGKADTKKIWTVDDVGNRLPTTG